MSSTEDPYPLGIESCDSPKPGSLPQGEGNVWTDEDPLFKQGSGWRLDPTLISLLQKSEMEFRLGIRVSCGAQSSVQVDVIWKVTAWDSLLCGLSRQSG